MSEVELTVRTIHTGEQYVPAICERVPGSEKVWCLFGNAVEGVQTVSISIRDHDHASEATFKGERYPVARLQEILKQIAARGLIQPSAVAEAQRLLPGFQPPAEIVDDVTSNSDPIDPKTVTADSKTPSRTILASVCGALGIEPAEARKRLRAAGLRAPYVDERLIRKTLETK